MNKPFWQTRTFWGAVILAAGRIVFSPADQRPAAITEGIGVILGAVGLRGAVAKNGNGQ